MKFKKLSPTAIPPQQETGSAGYDLFADEKATLKPGESKLISTGIAVEIQPGFVGLLFPRSGYGVNGLVLGNLTGVIDSTYRGEVKVCLWNRTTDKTFNIIKGQKMTQMVITAHLLTPVIEVDQLTETERGANGFGSTGG